MGLSCHSLASAFIMRIHDCFGGGSFAILGPGPEMCWSEGNRSVSKPSAAVVFFCSLLFCVGGWLPQGYCWALWGGQAGFVAESFPKASICFGCSSPWDSGFCLGKLLSVAVGRFLNLYDHHSSVWRWSCVLMKVTSLSCIAAWVVFSFGFSKSGIVGHGVCSDFVAWRHAMYG